MVTATALNDDHPNDQLQSPRAMAEAAVAEAMAERERRDGLQQRSSDDDDARQSKGGKNASMEDHVEANDNQDAFLSHQEAYVSHSLGNEDVDEKALEEVWKQPQEEDDTEWSADEAVETTLHLLNGNIEELVRFGLEAFHGLESTCRDLEQSVQIAETTSSELARLKASEEQSRSTISNLLRAVETSKSDTRDMSRVASVEARLRKELSNLRSERDEALAEASESKRKSVFLQEEVRMVKAKLGRVTQEKIKLERDSRAAISLARSLDSHASSDSDFYKRKVAELNDHLQAQQALVTEQKHQIDEMRRQMERSMSQNRLAHIRAEAGRGKKRSM